MVTKCTGAKNVALATDADVIDATPSIGADEGLMIYVNGLCPRWFGVFKISVGGEHGARTS